MSPTAPDRSLEQRRDALARANRIRSYRAALKRELKAGQADPVDLLLEPPEELDTAKVLDLLLAVPKVGRVKANRILVCARVSPSRTLGGLSPRQRTELVALLRTYSPELRRQYAHRLNLERTAA